MNRPVTDYRKTLDAKTNFTSVRAVKLRTRRRAGDLEILRDPRDGLWKRYRHGKGFEPLASDSDGSGEAGETALAGSTEGDSAGPKDIAR